MDDIKLSCTSRLALVHRLVLRGVVYKHVERPPFQHTFGPEVDFYQLQDGEEWEHVIRESSLSLYVHPVLDEPMSFCFGGEEARCHFSTDSSSFHRRTTRSTA